LPGGTRSQVPVGPVVDEVFELEVEQFADASPVCRSTVIAVRAKRRYPAIGHR
jgi:hypothetical protein